jgi:hypothetical protein
MTESNQRGSFVMSSIAIAFILYALLVAVSGILLRLSATSEGSR